MANRNETKFKRSKINNNQLRKIYSAKDATQKNLVAETVLKRKL